jgi:hypothetical protein
MLKSIVAMVNLAVLLIATDANAQFFRHKSQSYTQTVAPTSATQPSMVVQASGTAFTQAAPSSTSAPSVATYSSPMAQPAPSRIYSYSYYASPQPARTYVGYGADDFPFYGVPYGHPYDPWTWPYMTGSYNRGLARYYDPPVK